MSTLSPSVITELNQCLTTHTGLIDIEAEKLLESDGRHYKFIRTDDRLIAKWINPKTKKTLNETNTCSIFADGELTAIQAEEQRINQYLQHISELLAMAKAGNSQELSKLLNLGLSPNTLSPLNEIKQAPLHVAVQHSQIECCKLLLERKANPNVKNAAGQSPLEIALAKLDHKIIKLLLTYKPDLTSITSFNEKLGDFLAQVVTENPDEIPLSTQPKQSPRQHSSPKYGTF